LDRAQVLWSQSVCALRSQVSGLIKPKDTSAQNVSAEATAEEAQNRSADAAEEACDAAVEEDQPAADVPVFSGESYVFADLEVEAGGSNNESTNDLTDEGTQQASDEIEAKWHEMASRVGEAPATTAENIADSVGSTAPSATSDAAPESAESMPDHEPTLVGATRFDRVQVALSMSMSALRSQVSRVRVPNPVTVQ